LDVRQLAVIYSLV